ncbi:hypothetical protein U9M48_004075 [Paspalum notatum var. saurae]|uniref:DUF4218 domain-containing protein n=1 Tax=Paspalum notatum var. saurae TaxID=547442 RepID=A0AAQ3PUU8_PASNO
MKYEFMFLCLIIPGPEHPGPKINVMLQPLIKELKQLWYGVDAYDISLKQKFTLRAAYLWSVHDFMAYGIFAGWSVYGTLTCPICGVDTRCFRLEFGGKICYFDCHRCWLPSDHIFRGEKDSFRKDTVCYEGPPKRLSAQEILDQFASLKLNEEKIAYEGFGKEHNWTHISGIWDLPYAKALKLPHNIDVMHQERKVAESIISTCMDFSDKTKDNVKAQKDLAKICKWPTLELTASGAKVGGPMQFRWMFHIERDLKYLRAMVGNKARVEGCIAEAFILKEISYFNSVYFAEEYNVNAPTMRYNVDEEPSASDLPIFQSTGASASASSPYYFKPGERVSAYLYMYANMKEMDSYFKEFHRQNWTSKKQPTMKM